MRKITLIISIFFACSLFIDTYAQKEIKDNRASFFKLQEEFNKQNKGKKYEKGKGFKQFKRWEWFMEQRVDESGKIPLSIVWTENEKLKKRSTKSILGNWESIGPHDTPTQTDNVSKRGSGRVNAVAFHPTDPDIIFVGAPSGGLWKTTNGGVSWYTTTDNLPSMGVSDIAINPNSPQTIYIATGDGDAGDTYSIGVLKSNDGGETWSTTGLDLTIYEHTIFRRLLINPNNPDILIAAANNGIYKSEDAAASWDIVETGHFKDLEFKPGNPNIIYATSFEQSGGAQIYYSTNGGDSFSAFSNTGINSNQITRINLAVSAAAPENIYALCAYNYNEGEYGYAGFYKSTDGGQNWTYAHTPNINLLGWQTDGDDSGGQGWYDLSLAVSPTNPDEIYVGGVNTWKSLDGGFNWNNETMWYHGTGSEYMHADQHVFAYNPVNNVLYAGNDGGIYKKTSGNWVDISDGLEILQTYRMSISRVNEFKVLCGNQDNGTFRKEGDTWHAVIGGDGMECIIDHTNPNVMYGTIYYGSIYKSTDGGDNFSQDASPPAGGSGAWVTPYVMHPTNSDILYAGYSSVYKTENGGSSWVEVSSNLASNNLQSMAISTQNPDYVYTADYYSAFKTTDAGDNWSQINIPNTGENITYIGISPYSPDEVYLTFSGYSENEKVYKSTDGGLNWENYSAGLPNVPANCIVTQEGSTIIYVGTDLGVFVRDADATEWQAFNEGLPNVIINEMEIDYQRGKLVAATYGRGMWESDLYSQEGVLSASFSYFSNDICSGEFNFYNTSAGETSVSWNFGDGSSSTENNPNHTYSSTGAYTVVLTVQDDSGNSDTYEEQIEINAESLNVNFEANQQTFCRFPIDVEFNMTSNGGQSYEWDFGDGNTSTEQNPTHTYNQEGSYDITLTVSSGICGNAVESRNNYISIDPNNSQEVIMPNESSKTTLYCCSGNLLDPGGTSNYSSNNTGYICIDPENNEQIQINFDSFDVEEGSSSNVCDYDKLYIYDGTSLNASLIGTYCNSNPPPASITSTGDAITFYFSSDSYLEKSGFNISWSCISTDINNEAYNNDINIYPNPSKGIFNIKRSNAEKIFVSVKDITGKLIFEKIGNKKTFNIDISFAPAGIYLIELESGNETIHKKIMIE